MALINCPECGRQVSDTARNCPGCGYEISKSTSSKIAYAIGRKPLLIGVGIAIIIICIVSISWNETDYRPSQSNNSYGQTQDNNLAQPQRPVINDSTIFNNLKISNFSASLGKHGGEMKCEVLNNNSFTVRGYFYVNFYDKSGKLMYSQLMSVPSVASGEKVVCKTLIPKDSYPSGYSYVRYTQASLTKS
jgi:hypothetical protein